MLQYFSLSISDSEKLAGFTKYNSLLITFKTEVFDGNSYTSAFSKTKSFEFYLVLVDHGEPLIFIKNRKN